MYSGLRSKMKKGVYLPSLNQDSGLLVRCLQVLLNTYPSILFTSIYFDEKVHGYKIHFSEPDETEVLKENYLVVGNDHVWIYPLTSFLTVHDVIKNPSHHFNNDLQDAIENKFGKLLHIEKFEKDVANLEKKCLESSEFRENFEKKSPKTAEWRRKNEISEKKALKTVQWRIEVDVPEFKGLKAFCEENFDLEIYLPNWNQKLKATFWCRSCKQNNHFQHECVRKEDAKKMSIGMECGIRSPCGVKKTQAEVNANTQSTSYFDSDTDYLSNFSSDNLDYIAEDIGREEVMKSGILPEEKLNIRQTLDDAPSSSSPESKIDCGDILKHIKKEICAHAKEERSGDQKIEPSESSVVLESHVVVKREPCTSPIPTNEDSLNNSFLEPSPSSNDDDIQVLRLKRSPTHILPHDSNTGGRDGDFNSEDGSMSPTNIKTEFSFPKFCTLEEAISPSTSVTTASRSNRSTAFKPATRVEVTTSLSERLQDCINSACDTYQVLDRKTLDAFLIHVKKKSNPVRVALNFTKNASDLKGQLKQILHLYYNTPQTGTKEDMQFIKWLNGLVDRFDGTIPRKRKRNDRSDESPSKK